MLTELRTKSQITIPKDIVMKMGLREGDKLEIVEKDGVIELMPVAVYPKKYLDELRSEIRPDSIQINDHIAVIAVVGRKMAFRVGTSGKIFAALGKAGINIRMISQGPDELNIIVGVDTKDFAPAIQVLYNSFVK